MAQGIVPDTGIAIESLAPSTMSLGTRAGGLPVCLTIRSRGKYETPMQRIRRTAI